MKKTALAVTSTLALSAVLAGCASDGASDGGTPPPETAAQDPSLVPDPATSSTETETPSGTADVLVIDDPDAATCWLRTGVEDATGQVLITDTDSYICFSDNTFVWGSTSEAGNREGTWTGGGGVYTLTTGTGETSARLTDGNLYAELPGTGKTQVDVFALYGLCQDPEACLADPTWRVGRD